MFWAAPASGRIPLRTQQAFFYEFFCISMQPKAIWPHYMEEADEILGKDPAIAERFISCERLFAKGRVGP